jgi:alanyl-tRNA synthetase
VHRLGDIGLFTILSESAVAAGVRRIEALTSEGARRYLSGQAEIAREAAAALKTATAELPARVAQLADANRKLERELAEARRQVVMGAVGGAHGESSVTGGGRSINGVPVDMRIVEGIAVADGKASLVVGVTDDLVGRISAVDLVKIASEALGGKGGGGRPDMAQAGGPDGARAKDALDAIERRLAELQQAQ